MTNPQSPLGRRHHVVERHGLLTLVRTVWGDDVLVEFQASPAAWVCSECGVFPFKRKGAASTTCDHIVAAGRTMPLETANRVAALASPAKPGTGASLSTKAGGASVGVEANRTKAAEVLEKSAEVRAERHRPHDVRREAIDTTPVVRKLTPDEVAARLAERRKRKRIGD